LDRICASCLDLSAEYKDDGGPEKTLEFQR